MRKARFSFLAKAAAALLLIALADFLFYPHEPGWTIGLFALAWTAAVAVAVPGVRRRAVTIAWLAGAAAFGLILIEAPGLLAWTLFWVCLSIAVLLPRLRRIDNALRLCFRLALHWASSAIAALGDLLELTRIRKRRPGPTVRGLLATMALPLLGGVLFLMLFASANPLIENALQSLRFGGLDVPRLILWTFFLLAVWPSLRPRKLVTAGWKGAAHLVPDLPGASMASVTLSLILFNALFAVQNGLDLAFLWSGAPLPEGMTLAEYAHRGAYPLIATALLAGLFVLLTTRPGSDSAASPLIRRLVLLWIAQNLLLVASSMLRTIDYIEIYSLTELRIAALMWMGLVALGLVLICWRLFRGRSSAWLINANAAAALAVLSAATLVDLGATSAQWNVRHAREVGGEGAPIDLCYLNRLDSAALLPLIELELRPVAPDLRDRARYLREQVMARLADRQDGWRQWSFRDSRGLRAARAALGSRPLRAQQAPHGRRCDGTPLAPPPPPPPPVPAPLTGEAPK